MSRTGRVSSSGSIFSPCGSVTYLFFHASGDTRAQYQLLEKGVLAAQGVIVDHIVATCRACLIDRMREQDYIPELLELACPDASFKAQYPPTNTPESKLLAFWHTLNGGMQMILEDSNRYKRRLRGSTDLSRCLEFLRFMTAADRRELWSTDMEHILLDVESGTRGRTMFRTKNGLLGVGPAKCQPGDQVIVLLGGNMPYIVRKAPSRLSRDCFTILGDSYVHGIMDGEALIPQDGDTCDLTEIVLV